MDYKKKLRIRLYLGISYIVIGILMLVGGFVLGSTKDFIWGFGFSLALVGIVRVRNYFLITKSEESIRQREIIETDERNISIQSRAKGAAFTVYVLLMSVVVLVLSFLSMHEVAAQIACCAFALIVIYWICYFIYQKRF